MKFLKVILCVLCLSQITFCENLTPSNAKSNAEFNAVSSTQSNADLNEKSTPITLESTISTSNDNTPNNNTTQTAQDTQNLNMTLSPPFPTQAQTQTKLAFLYNAGFDFLLDNIENTHLLFWDTRTRYALRVNGEVGLGIYGSHKLWLGGYGLQDMGQKRVFNAGGGILAYYDYSSGDRGLGNFNASLGILPRKKLLKTYPKSFFRDDFLFFAPASNGVLLQYSKNSHALESKSYTKGNINAKAELLFDWFGGNLAKRDDEFFLLFGSEIGIKNSLNIGLDALVFHFKNSEVLGRDNATLANGNPDTFLLDRILYNGYVEVDFRGFVPAVAKHFTKAQVGLAALGQIERKRRLSGNEPFYIGAGYEARAKLEYKGFGIEESYYFGKPQMRYFSQYKESVYEGLPLYQREFNRVNAYYVYENTFLRTQVSLIFYSFGGNLATQQMLEFSINTDKITKPKKLR